MNKQKVANEVESATNHLLSEDLATYDVDTLLNEEAHQLMYDLGLNPRVDIMQNHGDLATYSVIIEYLKDENIDLHHNNDGEINEVLFQVSVRGIYRILKNNLSA